MRLLLVAIIGLSVAATLYVLKDLRHSDCTYSRGRLLCPK